MTLNTDDNETEKLAEEVAEMTGDTKTGAVREALREKKERLEMRTGGKEKRDLREFFETEIWPLLPEEELGQPPMSKEEVEDLLGYDEDTLRSWIRRRRWRWFVARREPLAS